MSKNVAVFVDVANIFYAAKAAGVDIDYVTLLRSATAGRDFVRAYAYTGLDPDNENQRNFHQFLARHSYRVVSKDIRKYGDGKVKANLDIELVVDMMKTARNLDVAVLVSGDGDFAPAIRAVQEMGVRVEVVSFRGNTSSDLIDVADLFTDITQIAKVEKGSTRSGRRVTEDDEDLSMTEVPDKQSEGTGEGRGRGRGRGPARGRDRGDAREPEREREEAPIAASSRAGLTALPGEKLSKVAAGPAADIDADEGAAAAVGATGGAPQGDGEGDADAEGRRRRRRRGGRGRGRGRGREEGVPGTPVEAGETPELRTPFEEEEEEEVEVAPRGRRPTPFGSVWDSQLGVPATRSSTDLEPLSEEDYEEPAIPEYLIAERRGGGRSGPGPRDRGGRGGGRGRGGAYAAAIDRERYGRGGPISRYPEPARGGGGGPVGGRGPRDDRFGARDRDRDRGGHGRPAGGGGAHRGSGDPWSEVPPELEELVRAQMARSKVSDAPPAAEGAARAPEVSADALAAETGTRAPRGRRPRAATAEASATTAAAAVDAGAPASEAPKRRTTRRTATAPEPATAEGVELTAAAPKRTTRRSAAATESGTDAPPKATRGTRTRRTTATDGADVAPTGTATAESAPRRRTRRVASDAAEG